MKGPVLLTIAVASLLPAAALAGYPFISAIPNVQMDMNSSSGSYSFQVDDDTTPPEQLAVSATSNNPALIPADASHVRIGGQGKNRTVAFTPLPGRSGSATVAIIVTDIDGESNSDTVDIEVLSASQSSQSLEN